MRLCSTGRTGAATWCGRARSPPRWPRAGACPCSGSMRRGGLRVIGRLSAGAAGREAAALLKEGTVRGLSFGYRVREAAGESPRELRAVELVEVSLVTFPMQPKARVHALEDEAAAV